MAKSLEDSIAELNVSVIALTAALASGKTTTATAAKDKPATARTPAKDKPPTVAALKKAAEDFLEGAGKDEDEYAARRAYIKTITAKFEAPKLTEVKEGERQDALDMLNAYEPAEKPEEDNDI